MNIATTNITANSIEKTVDVKAPIERVWRALTDHEEFGAWFGLTFSAPFVPGKTAPGVKTLGSCGTTREQNFFVQKMEPPHHFSVLWHPFGVDPKASAGPVKTLIVFTLETIPTGTRLRVVESGFDKVPEALRAEAVRMHTAGWIKQMENVKAHVE